MKKSILITMALCIASNAFAAGPFEGPLFKKMAYAIGIVMINEAASYELSVSGLLNDVTKFNAAGSRMTVSWVPINPITKRFTITATEAGTGKVVAKETFTRKANQDVFIVNVSTGLGFTSGKITLTPYAVEVARGMPKYKVLDL